MTGGKVDRNRAAGIVINDFRDGKLGRITLEIARKMQAERYLNSNLKNNSELLLKDIEKYCQLDQKSQKILNQAYQRLKLSVRGYIRLMRVARTIADLNNNDLIKESDLIEAVDFRWYAEKSEMLL